MLNLIQWFGVEGIESINPYCICINRILGHAKEPFKLITFDVPINKKTLGTRLTDVPVLKGQDFVAKGYSESLDTLKANGLLHKLHLDNKDERAQCNTLHEWAMLSFFPISIYLTYCNEKNYSTFSSMIKSTREFKKMHQQLGDDQTKTVLKMLKENLIRDISIPPTISATNDSVMQHLYDKLQLLSDQLGGKRFLVRNNITLADIATFSLLVRIFYIEEKLTKDCKNQFPNIFRWMEKVESLTANSNSVKPKWMD